ncbi:MAG TPA: biotin/lipoyl-containing protein [Chloroflexota bacterium]|nr:biotin/lipoyl-containing protein [Chloroflexota bacterium]
MSEQAADPSASLVQLVEQVVAELDGTAVLECELRSGDHRVLVRRSLTSVSIAAVPGADDREALPPDWKPLVAPLTGIFYLTETPQSPPFVSSGGPVSEGQVVGLIESMKMFNPVESDVSGTIRSIVVSGGALVEKGQILMYVEPLGDLS